MKNKNSIFTDIKIEKENNLLTPQLISGVFDNYFNLKFKDLQISKKYF